MGCCEAKNILDITDNDTENRIRKVIYDLELTNLDFKEFDEKFKKIISVSILDVDDVKWYNMEHYLELINIVFLNNEHYVSPSESIDSILAKRHGVFKNKEHAYFVIKPELDKKNFPFYFICQIISLLNDSIDDKIEVLEKACRFHLKILSVTNFKKFIVKYLEVNLIHCTLSYIEGKNSGSLDDSYLINTVYTKRNVELFSRSLLKSVERTILKYKPLLNESGLSNEFIRQSDFKEFFYQYKVLLDNLELRKLFYDKFSGNNNDSNENTFKLD